jgi:hypothetical protein
MSETLVDPVPPTQRDGEPLPEPTKPVRSSRVRLIAAVAISLVALVTGAAVVIYLFVWRYDPVARAHIPGNATMAGRIEVADIVLFGPVRKHLWEPVFSSRSGRGSSSGKTRSERIGEATGVNVATDLREIVFASVDAKHWVVILGGKIPRGRFVDGLSRLATEESWPGFQRSGELLLGPTGVAIGQAADGAIVIGTDTGIVMAALPATNEWKRLGLPEQGTATFAVTKPAFNGASSVVGKIVPGGRVFSQIERATGNMVLGNAPELSIRVQPSSANGAAALAGDIDRLLGSLKLLLLLAPDVAGEQGALSAAQVRVDGADVAIRAPWPYEGLDKGCARLASVLQVVKGE